MLNKDLTSSSPTSGPTSGPTSSPSSYDVFEQTTDCADSVIECIKKELDDLNIGQKINIISNKAYNVKNELEKIATESAKLLQEIMGVGFEIDDFKKKKIHELEQAEHNAQLKKAANKQRAKLKSKIYKQNAKLKRELKRELKCELKRELKHKLKRELKRKLKPEEEPQAKFATI